MIPDYAVTYGTTDGELATASERLQAAMAGLPARCFIVTTPPGIGAQAAGASG